MLINPSNLYSGGNVRLDPTPYLNIALRQQARKQALEESANQYFSKLPEKLNTAGVRNQDLEDPNGNGGILKDLDDIKTYWFQNKDGIRKGGMAQQQYLGKIQQAQQKIQASKARGKLQLETGKYSLSGKWTPMEEDQPVLSAIERSIYDPNSKKDDGVTEYSMNDLSASLPDYTPDYQLKYDKTILGGLKPDRLKGDNGVVSPREGKVTYQHGYSPEKIDLIMNKAIEVASSDLTMRRHYKEMLANPEVGQRASAILQAEYDKSHNDGKQVVADTPEEIAAALAIEKYTKYREPKTYTDQQSLKDWQAEMLRRRQSFSREQQNKREARKDSRLKAMLGEDIPDVLSDADDIAESMTIEQAAQIGMPFYTGTEELIPVDQMDARKQDDILGKKDQYFQRPNKPYRIGDQEYIVKKDGKYYADGLKEISPEEVRSATYTRKKDQIKTTQKGIINKGSNQTGEKPMTLAEKMKAAKKSK